MVMIQTFPFRIKQSGFTLVEMALAMVVIGLLIAIVIGGAKIRDNAQTMDVIKQLTLYEASAIKFRDIYGSLPGDIVDPSARLTNCNAAPCNRAGDGDKSLDTAAATASYGGAITTSSERFVFWNHLLTAGLVTGYKGTDDTRFGEGQPAADVLGGFRVTYYPFANYNSLSTSNFPHLFVLSTADSAAYAGYTYHPCALAERIDRKIDDGLTNNGHVQPAGTCGSPTYSNPAGVCYINYITKF